MHSSDLIKELKDAGCFFVRHGKGDHQSQESDFQFRTQNKIYPSVLYVQSKNRQGFYSSAEL